MTIHETWKLKVNDAALRSLAEKCLNRVRDLYPGNYDAIIEKYYAGQIETLALAKQTDHWSAAVDLYNGARTVNEKVFHLAAALYLENKNIAAPAR